METMVLLPRNLGQSWDIMADGMHARHVRALPLPLARDRWFC